MSANGTLCVDNYLYSSSQYIPGKSVKLKTKTEKTPQL